MCASSISYTHMVGGVCVCVCMCVGGTQLVIISVSDTQTQENNEGADMVEII